MAMSRYRIGGLCAVVASLALGAGELRAQPPRPGFSPPPPPGGFYRPPPFSPYLNLLRGGTPTLNYYGLVRPEMQLRQGLQNLSSDVMMNQQMIGELSTGLGLPQSTGHPTQFMNLGGYFMNSGGGGMGASILGAAPRGGTLNLAAPAGAGGAGGAGGMSGPAPSRRR
jgi:hypothetical protein